MTPDAILPYVVGPYGVLVVLCVIVFVLYRENKSLRTMVDQLQEERIKDAKSAEMLAKAYLSLREQEMQR